MSPPGVVEGSHCDDARDAEAYTACCGDARCVSGRRERLNDALAAALPAPRPVSAAVCVAAVGRPRLRPPPPSPLPQSQVPLSLEATTDVARLYDQACDGDTADVHAGGRHVRSGDPGGTQPDGDSGGRLQWFEDAGAQSGR